MHRPMAFQTRTALGRSIGKHREPAATANGGGERKITHPLCLRATTEYKTLLYDVVGGNSCPTRFSFIPHQRKHSRKGILIFRLNALRRTVCRLAEFSL